MIYRVGADGATVVASDGRVVQRLRPGLVIVPGMLDDQAARAVVGCPEGPLPSPRIDDGERVVGYETKPIRPRRRDG